MGILDQYPELALGESDKNDALNMGLLQAGLGILANNTSRNAMPTIAKGGMMGLQGYQQSIDRAQAKKLEELKMRDVMEKYRQQKLLQDRKNAIINDPATDPTIKAYLQQGGDLEDLMKPRAIKEGERFGMPDFKGGFKELATGAAKAPKTTIESVAQPGGLWRDFYASDGKVDESKPVGVPYAKRATASDTSVTLPKIDVKLGESVAGQVGPMLKESKLQAAGAVNMFDSADRLEKALASNKVLTGPLSSASLTVRQFLDPKGKSPEILETRKAVRALAESTVNARKALQGQGQITEQEGQVAAKAESGDIDSMTAGELKILVNLNKRAAKLRAQEHQSMLAEAEKEPSTKKLTGFYKVGGIDPILSWTDPTAAKSIRQQADAIVGR